MPDTPEPMYNLKAVVQRTGIPAASLRAWEKRYGFIQPVRKPNGHRVYLRSDIDKLLRLKTLMAQGMTVSQAAQAVGQVRASGDEATEVARLALELKKALAEWDLPAANRAMAAAIDLLSADQLCLRLLRPLITDLQPFGRTYLRLRLGAMLLHAPALATETALVLNPDPEDLQPLLVATFLSRRGYRVIYVEGTEPLPGTITPDLVVDPTTWLGGLSPEQLWR